MSTEQPLTVILGPHIDLHTGIHTSMQEDRPEGVFFHTRGGRHYFASDQPAGGDDKYLPFEQQHLGEVLSFGPGPQVAHSARWPVVDRRAWVVDLDDFGYPFVLGRHMFNPRCPGAGGPWTEEAKGRARERAQAMLEPFSHESCKAVLFRTHRAVQETRAWLDRLGLTSEGEPFLAKSQVVPPAQRPLLPELVQRKWASPQNLQVLFIGNDYEAKCGRLALDLFHRLGERFPGTQFTYVGQVPESERAHTEGIDYRGLITRAEVLKLLSRAHVLFHPSPRESFGMVLLEAAANGMAVVVSFGPGMEHVPEIFGPGEGWTIDRFSLAPEEVPGAYEDALAEALSDREATRERALACYQRVLDGPFSVSTQGRALQEVYRRAADDPAPEPLALQDLSAWREQRTTSQSSQELTLNLKAFSEGLGMTQFAYHAWAW